MSRFGESHGPHAQPGLSPKRLILFHPSVPAYLLRNLATIELHSTKLDFGSFLGPRVLGNAC